jgi:hypothetical protein
VRPEVSGRQRPQSVALLSLRPHSREAGGVKEKRGEEPKQGCVSQRRTPSTRGCLPAQPLAAAPSPSRLISILPTASGSRNRASDRVSSASPPRTRWGPRRGLTFSRREAATS